MYLRWVWLLNINKNQLKRRYIPLISFSQQSFWQIITTVFFNLCDWMVLIWSPYINSITAALRLWSRRHNVSFIGVWFPWHFFFFLIIYINVLSCLLFVCIIFAQHELTSAWLRFHKIQGYAYKITLQLKYSPNISMSLI